jgi:protein phosphatase 1G
MGVYLSDPNTEKDTHTDESALFKWTSSEMQGWRKNMEDARICDLSIKVKDKKYAVFGVFDGHGGNKLLI